MATRRERKRENLLLRHYSFLCRRPHHFERESCGGGIKVHFMALAHPCADLSFLTTLYPKTVQAGLKPRSPERERERGTEREREIERERESVCVCVCVQCVRALLQRLDHGINLMRYCRGSDSYAFGEEGGRMTRLRLPTHSSKRCFASWHPSPSLLVCTGLGASVPAF